MKRTTMAILVMLAAIPATAAEEMQMRHPMMGSGMMHGMRMHPPGMARTGDSRTSLNLPAPMRRNQLAMMRGHLQAVDAIVGYLAEGKFDAASKVAHEKLGLTPEMKKMCDMLGKRNSHFRDMGLAFHRSADKLGEILKTGDIQRSLAALHRTMNYCVQCHATFRQ